MHKVPFMLWSPLCLPRHQWGRYDVHNIFTLNLFQLAFKSVYNNIFNHAFLFVQNFRRCIKIISCLIIAFKKEFTLLHTRRLSE